MSKASASVGRLSSYFCSLCFISKYDLPPYLRGSGSKPKAKEKTLLRLFPRHQKIVVESNQRLCNKGAAAGGRPALHDHRHDRDRRGESNRRRQGGDFSASLPWPGRQSSSGSHIMLIPFYYSITKKKTKLLRK